MSDRRFDWAGWLGWIADQIAFTGVLPSAESKTPLEEARDAADWEKVCEQARQADLREKSAAQEFPSSSDAKKPINK